MFLGCASAPQPQNPTLLAPTHGYALIAYSRIAGNLQVTSVKDKKKFNFRSAGEPGAQGLWLPEGSYKLTSIQHGAGKTKLEGFPLLEIKRGQITDMGSLTYFSIGEGKSIWLPKRFAINNEYAERIKSKYSQSLLSDEVLKWEPTEIPVAKEFSRSSSGLGLIVDWGLMYGDSLTEAPISKALKDVRTIDEFFQVGVQTLPPYATYPAVDAEGNYFYGSELGQVKRRSKEGKWSTIDTKHFYNISAVIYDNNTLYAVAQNNEVLVSKDKGESWESFLTFTAPEIIHDLDIVDNKIYILAGQKPVVPVVENVEEENAAKDSQKTKKNNKQQDRYAVKVYSTTFEERRLRLESEFVIEGLRNGFPKAEVFQNNYYIGQAPNFLYRLDLNSKEIKQLGIPEEKTSFSVSPVDGTISLFFAKGMFSTLHISTDSGENWKTLDEPSYHISNVHFRTPEEGFAYRIESNAFDVTHIAQKYDANKNKWKDYAVAPQSCKYLVPDENRISLFCVTFGDDILFFDGNEWKPEQKLFK